ncbi:SRPBCC domain-containing protein [Rhizobium sp. WYCCWR 11146]|nr:SRPBCC domain-containing protein [Rhizobium sp. WYCCWR 11146]
MHFLKFVPNERIVMGYGTPNPGDPEHFRPTVTFDEHADGKTFLTLRQRFLPRDFAHAKLPLTFRRTEYIHVAI